LFFKRVTTLTQFNDAFGHMLYDYSRGHEVHDVIERDDGYITVPDRMSLYFAKYDGWPENDRKAVDFAFGRILDIGVGAGRHALHLQDKGHDVLGIDTSPLAIYVCQERGLQNVQFCPITKVSSKLGLFDTILLLGNNVGLLANEIRAKWLFRRFHSMTSPNARIIAGSSNPHVTNDPVHLEYFEMNRAAGKLPGQLRIRYRYLNYQDDWFDYLFVSQKELIEIIEGTGWYLEHTICDGGPQYVGIMEKAPDR
jgi:SAM-dependent methyltransferase